MSPRERAKLPLPRGARGTKPPPRDSSQKALCTASDQNKTPLDFYFCCRGRLRRRSIGCPLSPKFCGGGDTGPQGTPSPRCQQRLAAAVPSARLLVYFKISAQIVSSCLSLAAFVPARASFFSSPQIRVERGRFGNREIVPSWDPATTAPRRAAAPCPGWLFGRFHPGSPN